MIQVSNLRKSFGGQLLLDDATFTINDGERVGLVGRNGSGKSTLFRILLGQEEPDGGKIITPQGYRIGHLTQHVSFTAKTVLDEGCLSLPTHDDVWQESYRVEAILQGLGLSREMFDLNPAQLSGGYQIRLMLGKVLIGEPQLLLLDEPNNYLDVVSIRWLKGFLRTWKNELVLITHDRDFMNSVTTHTMAIHRRKVRKLSGPTSKLYEQILTEEEVHEQTRLNESKRRQQMERFIERFRAQAAKAKAVQSRVKLLDKQGKMEALEQLDELEFRFSPAPFEARWMMHVEDLSFGFSENAPLFEKLSFSVAKGDRIAVIGPNGKGKTTLLNLLAREMEPQQGTIRTHESAKVGYFGQTNVQRLNPQNTVEEEVASVDLSKNRTLVRSICGAMMFEGDDALKRVSVLSGGERSRVLLGKILAAPSNILLLDEPNNHLDMESIDSLLEALETYDGAVILVSHSDMILHAVANRLIVFDDGQAQVFEGTYQDFLDRVGWAQEADTRRKKKKKQRQTDAAAGSLAVGEDANC